MNRVVTALKFAALACTGLLAGCAAQLQSSDSIFGLITPYRIDIVQGNVVTKEQVEALKVGMNRTQVRDVMGAPLVSDIFHANRWDYIFMLRRQGADTQRRALVLQFDGEVLKSIDAPALPGEREFVASISKFKGPREEPVLVLTEAQRKALPLPRPVAPETPEPSGAVRTYPPLEKP